jgi:cell division protease FtsH
MEKQHKFSLWYVLLGVWLVLLLHNMIASALMVENIPYSEFVKLVKEGKVAEIAISENNIQGRMIPSDGSSEERFLMRQTELNNRIATLLGGRAAEELVFNDISTGAHNDLSRATDMARSMVKEYGMSERLGQVYFAHKRQPQFLNPMPEAHGEYSDETARVIDEEVRRIIDDQYAVALTILRKNMDLLKRTAIQLLEDEVIEGPTLADLLTSVQSEKNDSHPIRPDTQPEKVAA